MFTMKDYITSLDMIDNIEASADLETSFAILEYYSKQLQIETVIDNSKQNGEVYQEGLKEAWESDTDPIKGREGEGTLIKILKFLPRLFRNVVKWIGSKIKELWGKLTGKGKNEEKKIEEEKKFYTDMDEKTKQEIITIIRDGQFSVVDSGARDGGTYTSTSQSAITSVDAGDLYNNPINNKSQMSTLDIDNSGNKQIHDGHKRMQDLAIMDNIEVNGQVSPATKSKKSTSMSELSIDNKLLEQIATGLLYGKYKNVKYIDRKFNDVLDTLSKDIEAFATSTKTGSAPVKMDSPVRDICRSTYQYIQPKYTAFLKDHEKLRELMDRKGKEMVLEPSVFWERTLNTKNKVNKCNNGLLQIANSFDTTTTIIGQFYKYTTQQILDESGKSAVNQIVKVLRELITTMRTDLTKVLKDIDGVVKANDWVHKAYNQLMSKDPMKRQQMIINGKYSNQITTDKKHKNH